MNGMPWWALLAAGCFRAESELRIPCADDAHCPTAFWCEADGYCSAGDRTGPPLLEFAGAAADEGPVTPVVTLVAGDVYAVRVAVRNVGEGVSVGGRVEASADGCVMFELDQAFTEQLAPGEGWAATAAATAPADCAGEVPVTVRMSAGLNDEAFVTSEGSFRVLVVEPP